MDLKKEVEVLENILKLCMRVQIQGFEAEACSEAVRYAKSQFDSKAALLPKPEVKDVPNDNYAQG